CFDSQTEAYRSADVDAQIAITRAVLQDLAFIQELVFVFLRSGLLLEHHDSGFVQIDCQGPVVTLLFQQGQALLKAL
ncbi:hypothetical protein F2P79_012881, partial [Pimephales promelas]